MGNEQKEIADAMRKYADKANLAITPSPSPSPSSPSPATVLHMEDNAKSTN